MTDRSAAMIGVRQCFDFELVEAEGSHNEEPFDPFDSGSHALKSPFDSGNHAVKFRIKGGFLAG